MIRQLDNPLYYLDNFHQVLDWIAARYPDLLTDDEHAFLAAFPTLPQPARALFVRMVMRKGTVFRASKLNYAEIGCPVEAARHLAPTGWIEHDPQLTLDELFALLTKAELCAVFGLSGHEQAARKPEQLAALRTVFADPRAFSAWCKDSPDTAFRILAKPLCDRLRLIFFGNLRQDWTEFVLSELGVYKFEQVEFSESSRAFRSRRDVDLYMALHTCKERFREGEPLDDVLRDVPPEVRDNDWLRGRREKLMYQIGQHYEKLKDWKNAHAVYADCRYPGARARAIRVLEKDEQYKQAWDLLSHAQQQPESDAERQHVLRIAPRLRRKLGHMREPAAKVPVVRIDLSLPMPQGDWWVEGVVREHLHRDEAPVFYVENTLINGLFGLLCWQPVFMALPGAFFHPFHHEPADLYSPDFYPRREREFRACFAQLESDEYRATILRNFEDKHGIQSPFVVWPYLSEELLQMALDCIPPAHLKRAFERILADIKANRSGFPDLIQFWPAERRYHMIEVKGPGDRLQDNQLRWIEYCAAHQMPVSVCYLTWAESTS
ncbi:VRR-NUC domain-containing protein [Massilia arenosa]|uniref:phosphodiesterase I n=1 Tax=Zemynaea arenosa TaxID=2561931 RepID=A0A4Y9SNN1_9BURK|nr:VRR-NUC domain-containing protein [Massilia arenosa]TFW28081.1 VRR-NUC domain-containing protein [Massilia arenosa]